MASNLRTQVALSIMLVAVGLDTLALGHQAELVVMAAVVQVKLATQTAMVLAETDLMRTQLGLVQPHQAQADITQVAVLLMIKTEQVAHPMLA